MKSLAHGWMKSDRPRKLGWGLVDQAASSVTNLLLTIAAARVLGARSLGVVVMGFTVYLVLVGLQRVLVTQPLVVSTAALPAHESRDSSRAGLTVTLIGGAAAMVITAGIGVVAGGAVGRALLLFAPWLPSGLLQDFWRSTLFRDSRGRAAAANDLLWLMVMAPALAAAWVVGTDWAIVTAWGLGASAGAVAGFVQMRLRLLGPAKASKRWRSELWPFGRWLFGGGIVYIVCWQASVFLIAALLGPASVGGLYAVQTVFAPLTVLSPAIALPALPAMARRVMVGAAKARKFALQVSGLLVGLTTTYVVLVALYGYQLLNAVFGRSFGAYDSLILPVATEQVIAAAGGGLWLLLSARKRGGAIFAVRAITGPLGLALVAISAAAGGLLAVAWSMVATTVAVVAMTGVFALGDTEVLRTRMLTWRLNRRASEP